MSENKNKIMLKIVCETYNINENLLDKNKINEIYNFFMCTNPDIKEENLYKYSLLLCICESYNDRSSNNMIKINNEFKEISNKLNLNNNNICYKLISGVVDNDENREKFISNHYVFDCLNNLKVALTLKNEDTSKFYRDKYINSSPKNSINGSLNDSNITLNNRNGSLNDSNITLNNRNGSLNDSNITLNNQNALPLNNRNALPLNNKFKSTT